MLRPFLILSSVLAAGLAPAQVLLDFDTAADFPTGWTQSGTPAYTRSATGGLGNSGRVVGTGGPTATFGGESFRFASVGDVLRVSAFFQFAWTDDDQAVLELGFGTTPSTAISNAGSFLYSRLRTGIEAGTVQWQLRTGDGTAGSRLNDPIGDPFALTPGSWYQLEFAFVHEAGGVSIAGTVRASDAAGNLGAPVGSGLVAFVPSANLGNILADDDVYAGFRLSSFGTTGMDRFVAVPEPSFAALVLAGGAGLVLARRRRRP